jgi:hypothetical protein
VTNDCETGKKNIYLEIITLENIYLFGTALKNFFSAVCQEIVSPMGLHVNIVSKPFYRRQRRYLMNRENWSHITKQLVAGYIEKLMIVDKSFRPGTGVLKDVQVLAGIKGPIGFPYCANGVDLSVRPALADLADVQDKLVDIALETFTALKGVSGYLTVGDMQAGKWSVSPYEKSFNPDYRFASWTFRNKLRGAFWGNLLSAEHISKLGGMERIKKEAPVFRVKATGSGDNQGVFLQLSPLIGTDSPKKLQGLHEYLAPILPGISKDSYSGRDIVPRWYAEAELIASTENGNSPRLLPSPLTLSFRRSPPLSMPPQL